jgi:hypothetical protein
MHKTWKKKTTYKRPKCWWGHQPLKWGRVPTKSTIIIGWRLRVFVNLINYEKAKVHGGRNDWVRWGNGT